MLFVCFVSASQDANIFLNTQNTGLCLSIDNPNTPICDNKTAIVVDGTNDHVIYILPETELKLKSNITAKMEYIIFTPLNAILSGMFMWLIFMIVFFLALIIMVTKGLIRIT